MAVVRAALWCLRHCVLIQCIVFWLKCRGYQEAVKERMSGCEINVSCVSKCWVSACVGSWSHWKYWSGEQKVFYSNLTLEKSKTLDMGIFQFILN